jgi:integration host factor subunit beta
MLKSDLVRRIKNQNPHLFQRDVEKIVDAMLEAIVTALAGGDRVEMRGFGVFSVRHRRSRIGRNPRSQTAVSVEKKAFSYFRSGREIRKRLNPSTM